MIILIHSSKTMRPQAENSGKYQKPELIEFTKVLDGYLKTLSGKQIIKIMSLSPKLADKTRNLISSWNDIPKNQRPAIDSFLGDIYSGLQVQGWTKDDRVYANQSLRILSGLYGIIRPLDSIYPYRLEMGYKLPLFKFSNLYKFWGDKIAKTLPSSELIINLAAKEYSKAITDYISSEQIISPIFLTYDNTSNQPKFVVVHTKIARGAFANWLIKNRVNDITKLKDFTDLGYKYDKQLSLDDSPTYVCKSFGGLGLSVRLK